jgi:hypothetical protein
VGEFYGMTPEQFYDPRNTQPSQLAEGNGMNIYGEVGGKW